MPESEYQWPWYDAVARDTPVRQGDIIEDCSLTEWVDSGEQPIPSVGGRAKGTASKHVTFIGDVIVLSQACDLRDSSLRSIVVCRAEELWRYKEPWQQLMTERKQAATEKAWKAWCREIARERQVHYAMLKGGESKGKSTGYRLVEFLQVYHVPRAHLEQHERTRDGLRLSLLSPYREHVSQLFAKVFMRIGRPLDIKDDELEQAAGDNWTTAAQPQ